MANETINIDVIDNTIPLLNNRNIPIINQPNPCYGYSVTAKELKQLIQLSNYSVYYSGTKNIINGNNYYTYFPKENGGTSGNIGTALLIPEFVPLGTTHDVGFTPLSTIYATERYKMQYWQETTDDKTLCSLTVEPIKPCLLVVAVMHRSKSSDGSVTLNSDGWNHVITSAGIDSTNRNQRIDIFTKHVDTGSYNITSNPPNNGGIASMKAFALFDADSVSVVDNYWAHNVPIIPTPTTGKRRLYLLTSTYASWGSNPPMAVELHSSNTKTNMLAIEELRFSAFYDYELDGKTPAFTYCESYDNNMSILTLDINDTEDV